VNARICASATPGIPKIQLLCMSSRVYVTRPRRPSRKIMAKASTNGGVMIGRMLMTSSERRTAPKRAR
jgi:hypothetical protein